MRHGFFRNHGSVLVLLLLVASAPAGSSPGTDARAAIARRMAFPANSVAIELRMEGRWSAQEQARDPTVAAEAVPASQSLLLARDGRYRLESGTHAAHAPEFRFLTIGLPGGSATVDAMRWNRGIEIRRAPASTAREEHADLLFLAPALLLQFALESQPEVSPEGDATRISFRDALDREIVLTARKDGTIEAASLPGGRYVYADYRNVESLPQPSRIVQFAGGRVLAEWTIQTARSMSSLDDDAFTLPAGYVEAVDRGPLRATALGHGAYRVDGAPSDYHTGFVVGEHAVAVFDAPIGSKEAAEVKALIERTAPGRRIAYVIVSHPHGDHVGGLPVYLPGAQVIAGANAGVALRRQFPGTDFNLVELDRPRSLDLGGNSVQVLPLDSVHASTMLVLYAPQAEALYQADLLNLPTVGPRPPPTQLEGGMELAQLVAAQHLVVRHVVGVHGRTGSKADLPALPMHAGQR